MHKEKGKKEERGRQCRKEGGAGDDGVGEKGGQEMVWERRRREGTGEGRGNGEINLL